VGVALKIELAAAKRPPAQTRGGERHNGQGDGGLPVHIGNITALSPVAMDFSRGNFPAEKFAPCGRRRRLYARRMNGDAICHEHRVVYADCTLGNHVYYARYLELLEAARGEFLRRLGVTLLGWQERGWMFPVVEAHLRYQALARYDDVLRVETWVTLAEKVRLNFAYRITNQAGRLVSEGATRHVCMTLEEKPARLPAELVTALRPHLRSGPAS